MTLILPWKGKHFFFFCNLHGWWNWLTLAQVRCTGSVYLSLHNEWIWNRSCWREFTSPLWTNTIKLMVRHLPAQHRPAGEKNEPTAFSHGGLSRSQRNSERKLSPWLFKDHKLSAWRAIWHPFGGSSCLSFFIYKGGLILLSTSVGSWIN